jgi:hypothetical protein
MRTATRSRSAPRSRSRARWERTGSITAAKVQIEEGADDDAFGEAELHGTVQSLPATTGFIGDWVVSGITVHVTAATEIEAEGGMIAVGSFVEVKGLSEADGSITASKVELTTTRATTKTATAS